MLLFTWVFICVSSYASARRRYIHDESDRSLTNTPIYKHYVESDVLVGSMIDRSVDIHTVYTYTPEWSSIAGTRGDLSQGRGYLSRNPVQQVRSYSNKPILDGFDIGRGQVRIILPMDCDVEDTLKLTMTEMSGRGRTFVATRELRPIDIELGAIYMSLSINGKYTLAADVKGSVSDDIEVNVKSTNSLAIEWVGENGKEDDTMIELRIHLTPDTRESDIISYMVQSGNVITNDATIELLTNDIMKGYVDIGVRKSNAVGVYLIVAGFEGERTSAALYYEIKPSPGVYVAALVDDVLTYKELGGGLQVVVCERWTAGDVLGVYIYSSTRLVKQTIYTVTSDDESKDCIILDVEVFTGVGLHRMEVTVDDVSLCNKRFNMGSGPRLLSNMPEGGYHIPDNRSGIYAMVSYEEDKMHHALSNDDEICTEREFKNSIGGDPTPNVTVQWSDPLGEHEEMHIDSKRVDDNTLCIRLPILEYNGEYTVAARIGQGEFGNEINVWMGDGAAVLIHSIVRDTPVEDGGIVRGRDWNDYRIRITFPNEGILVGDGVHIRITSTDGTIEDIYDNVSYEDIENSSKTVAGVSVWRPGEYSIRCKVGYSVFSGPLLVTMVQDISVSVPAITSDGSILMKDDVNMVNLRVELHGEGIVGDVVDCRVRDPMGEELVIHRTLTSEDIHAGYVDLWRSGVRLNGLYSVEARVASDEYGAPTEFTVIGNPRAELSVIVMGLLNGYFNSSAYSISAVRIQVTIPPELEVGDMLIVSLKHTEERTNAWTGVCIDTEESRGVEVTTSIKLTTHVISSGSAFMYIPQLNDGLYKLEGRAEYEGAVIGTAEEQTFCLDTVAPGYNRKPMISLDHEYLNKDNMHEGITVRVAYLDGYIIGDVVNVYVEIEDNVVGTYTHIISLVDTDTELNIDVEDFDDGIYSVYAAVIDAAGNRSQESDWAQVIKVTEVPCRPVVGIDALMDGYITMERMKGGLVIDISCNGLSGASRVYVNIKSPSESYVLDVLVETQNGVDTAKVTLENIILEEGEYTLSVQLTDIVGNRGDDSEVIQFAYDSSYPCRYSGDRESHSGAIISIPDEGDKYLMKVPGSEIEVYILFPKPLIDTLRIGDFGYMNVIGPVDSSMLQFTLEENILVTGQYTMLLPELTEAGSYTIELELVDAAGQSCLSDSYHFIYTPTTTKPSCYDNTDCSCEPDMKDYQGNKNTSQTGDLCDDWIWYYSDVYMLDHRLTSNYCRYLTDGYAAMCLIEGTPTSCDIPKCEHCDIPVCPAAPISALIIYDTSEPISSSSYLPGARDIVKTRRKDGFSIEVYSDRSKGILVNWYDALHAPVPGLQELKIGDSVTFDNSILDVNVYDDMYLVCYVTEMDGGITVIIAYSNSHQEMWAYKETFRSNSCLVNMTAGNSVTVLLSELTVDPDEWSVLLDASTGAVISRNHLTVDLAINSIHQVFETDRASLTILYNEDNRVRVALMDILNQYISDSFTVNVDLRTSTGSGSSVIKSAEYSIWEIVDDIETVQYHGVQIDINNIGIVYTKQDYLIYRECHLNGRCSVEVKVHKISDGFANPRFEYDKDDNIVLVYIVDGRIASKRVSKKGVVILEELQIEPTSTSIVTYLNMTQLSGDIYKVAGITNTFNIFYYLVGWSYAYEHHLADTTFTIVEVLDPNIEDNISNMTTSIVVDSSNEVNYDPVTRKGVIPAKLSGILPKEITIRFIDKDGFHMDHEFVWPPYWMY